MFRKQIPKAERPSVFLFSSMLLLLESRTNAAITTMAKRESVQQEIDWRQSQERTIRDSFADVYMTRAQMAAMFYRAVT